MDSKTHQKSNKAGKRNGKSMCERDIVILNKVVSKSLIEGVILIPEGSREGDIQISGKTCHHFRPPETVGGHWLKGS